MAQAQPKTESIPDNVIYLCFHKPQPITMEEYLRREVQRRFPAQPPTFGSLIRKVLIKWASA